MNDDVNLSRAEYTTLAFDAACWRRWWQPDAVAWRREQAAWQERERFRQVSSDVSEGADWSRMAAAPTHAELVRRRAEPVVPQRCDEPRCPAVLSVPHPAPAHPVRCPVHRSHDGREAAA